MLSEVWERGILVETTFSLKEGTTTGLTEVEHETREMIENGATTLTYISISHLHEMQFTRKVRDYEKCYSFLLPNATP